MTNKGDEVQKLWTKRCNLVKQRIWANDLSELFREQKRQALWQRICDVDAELNGKWGVTL